MQTLDRYLAREFAQAIFATLVVLLIVMVGGAFIDVGSVWGLDDTAGTTGPVDDSMKLRSAAGVSLLWDTALGPLRFNFSKALRKESYDKEQSFDLTISTKF